MFALQAFKNPVYFFSVVVLVIASITLHELSHAVVAYSQGDDTAKEAGRFTLNPLAHMDKGALILLLLLGITWGQTPVNPSKFKHWWSDAWVSFAGPLINLILLFVFVALMLGVLQFGDPNQAVSDTQANVFQFLWIGALLNGVLFLLNMIPVPPLDGFAIAETFIPPLKTMKEKIGQYGFFALLIAVFVFNADQYLFDAAQWMVASSMEIFSRGL